MTTTNTPLDRTAKSSRIAIKLRTATRSTIELNAMISLDQWLRVLEILNEKEST